MIIVGIVLCFVGLGWLVFNLTVQATPVLAGLTAGVFVYRTGAGPIGAIAIGAVVAVITLVIGQFVFASIRSPLLKTLMAAAFALPAAVAGYHLVLGLSVMGTPSDTWRHVFAVIGAVVIGATAWARFIAHPFEKPGGHGVGSGLPQR